MSARPPSAAGSAATTTTTRTTASPSVSGLPQRSSLLKLYPVSNISLFLSNLRLLELDTRPDWPGVSAKIFDPKDVTQNQKKRISCVEWILFRLFQMLDPVMTRDVRLCPISLFSALSYFQGIEITAVLSATGATSVRQSSRCFLSLFQRPEEEWCHW